MYSSKEYQGKLSFEGDTRKFNRPVAIGWWEQLIGKKFIRIEDARATTVGSILGIGGWTVSSEKVEDTDGRVKAKLVIVLAVGFGGRMVLVSEHYSSPQLGRNPSSSASSDEPRAVLHIHGVHPGCDEGLDTDDNGSSLWVRVCSAFSRGKRSLKISKNESCRLLKGLGGGYTYRTYCCSSSWFFHRRPVFWRFLDVCDCLKGAIG